MNRLVKLTALLALIFSSSACDSNAALYPVEGTVHFHNQPAVGALIVLFPEDKESLNAVVPSGTVAADGSFRIDTNGKPGAPAGKYKVVVKIPVPPAKGKAKEGAAMGGDGENKGTDRIVLGTFADRSTTTISVEVKKPETKVDPIRLP